MDRLWGIGCRQEVRRMIAAVFMMLSSLMYTLQLQTGSFPAPLTAAQAVGEEVCLERCAKQPQAYVDKHPFNSGDSDCESVLDQLYQAYAESP